MNTQAPARLEIPEAILAEAGVWVARLHSPHRTPKMEADFQQWLKTSADHARAFEMTTEVWEEARNLPRVAYQHGQRRKARHQRALWSTVAAAAAVAVIAVAVLLFRSTNVVATGVGEQRVVVLEDDTRVYMNTDTRLNERYGEQRRQVDLIAGEALFDVARQPERPFVVRVGDREVTALGTSFIVRHAPDRTAVTLVEGKVAILSPPPVPGGGAGEGASAFTLSPGQRLTFIGSTRPSVDTPKLDKLLAWRRGQILLEETPLDQALEELNRYSTVKLVAEGDAVSNLKVDGLFQAGDSESFARAMAQTYGLAFAKFSDRIVLRRPN